VCLLFSAASLAIATCFGLAQRHQQKQWDEKVRRKVERKRKKQEMMKDMMGTSAGGTSAAKEGKAQKKQWIEDYEIPKEALNAKVP
jgi:hypothetical protein